MNNDGYLFLALKLKASFPKSLTMQAPALVYKVMKFDSHADEQLCVPFSLALKSWLVWESHVPKEFSFSQWKIN